MVFRIQRTLRSFERSILSRPVGQLFQCVRMTLDDFIGVVLDVLVGGFLLRHLRHVDFPCMHLGGVIGEIFFISREDR